MTPVVKTFYVKYHKSPLSFVEIVTNEEREDFYGKVNNVCSALFHYALCRWCTGFCGRANTQVAGAGYFDVMPLRVFLVHHAIDSCMIVDGQKADRGLGS